MGFNERAIILKGMDYAEYDRIIRILIENKGKASAIARSARKHKSRIREAVEPVTLGTYLFQPGRNMYTISQASVINPFLKVKSYLPSIMAATLVCELTDEFCEEEIEDPESFDLLLSMLEKMEESPELCAGIALYFEIQLHAINGIFPDLYQCICCGNKKTNPFIKLDLDKGGALCSICSSGKPDEKRYPIESLFVLEKASTSGIDDFLRSSFDSKPFQSAKEIISRFTSHYLRKELKSRRMFESALNTG